MKFKRALFSFSGPLLAGTLVAQEAAPPPVITLAPMIVTATRTPQPADTLPVSVDLFSADDLQASPAATIDDALRQSAAFSLFRRSSSLTANPTAQGVSLRGLGPSGASRSLVLLDGVPLNDPFGGWIAWTKPPKLSLDHVEIVRGGGSTAWGNAALGGTVQLFTAPLDTTLTKTEAFAGDHGTLGGEAAATYASASGTSAVRVDAAAFHTDGTDLVQTSGRIDRPADLDTQRAQVTFLTKLNPTTTLTVDTRAYAEDRGNGTPLQRNASHEAFLSATLAGTPAASLGPTAWSAVLYGQQQSFSSFFSSVNTTRTAETPANNQYDVPATAAGGAFTATWAHDPDATTTAGADARWVTGETREDYSWSVPLNQFTRRRYAGGDQTFLGAFVTHERVLIPDWHGSLGARLDTWQNTDGHRHEFDPSTGTVTRDDHYANEDGFAFSPNAGLVWQAAPSIRARTSVYEAFRVPTLNEYYRPFRVGSITTDANPGLKPEKLTGGELGVDFGDPRAGFSLTAFANEIRDSVANVTLTPTTRQRQNLDLVRVLGLEAGAHWQALPTLRLETDYLLSDARVIDGGAAASSLDGKQLAEVPRHTLTAGMRWWAPGDIQITANLRWVSAQYDDDANTLRLASATTVDLGVSRQFAHGWEVFAAIDNLFNATVETGLPSAGVVSIAPPRTVRGGVRWTW
ncbi:MAG TPA: TonB-dependent receptor [Rariglobus sp.]|jgi:outer membrane receptor protein involved in Fe transport|nr:TonB-dependent receptor [Rariglobus sp.]